MNSEKGLEKDIRMLLSCIQRDPSRYPPPDAAESIVKKVRATIFKRLHRGSWAAEVDDLFFPPYREGIISAFWYAREEAGMPEKDALRLTIAAMETVLGLDPGVPLTRAERVFVDKLVEIIEEGGTAYALEYASELGLIYHDGERWRLTALGEFLQKLPPFELSKALLSIEYQLARGNVYCMPGSFLEKLRELFSRNELHRVDFIASTTDHAQWLVLAWLNRLGSLGIVEFRDKYERVRVTEFGKVILNDVLSMDNPYSSLLRAITKGDSPPLSVNDVKAQLERMKDDSLLSLRWKEIEEALDSFRRGNYVSALRTVLPVIEHVLREIAVQEGVAGTNVGMKSLAGMLVGHRWLSERTEGLIKALGRDVDLHGHEPPDPDKAPFYALIALTVLAEVVRDYRRHKLLRRVFEEVAPRVGMRVEELLKAYPNDRSAVHVQFIRDNAVRVTVKGSYVFEAEEEGGSLRVKEAA